MRWEEAIRAPILVDSNEGAKILGISISMFYKFTRTNKSTPSVLIGTLQRWKREDLLRLTGKKFTRLRKTDDLIDAKEAAYLCSVSRPLFYKLNKIEMTPMPIIIDGRLIRWSMSAIHEWIEEGCPGRKNQLGRRGK